MPQEKNATIIEKAEKIVETGIDQMFVTACKKFDGILKNYSVRTPKPKY